MPNGNTVKHGWILPLFVSLYITKRSEAVLQWGKNIKKLMINGELVIEWKKEKMHKGCSCGEYLLLLENC